VETFCEDMNVPRKANQDMGHNVERERYCGRLADMLEEKIKVGMGRLERGGN
jgi:hypothetical protein